MIFCQTNYESINTAINSGEFSKAADMLDSVIRKGSLSQLEIYEMEFEKERMERIRKDFQKTEEDILKYVRRYFPDADANKLLIWEEDGSLEFKVIDGKKYYFNRAHSNLFRVNKLAKEQKIIIDGEKKDNLDLFLEEYLPGVIKEVRKKNDNVVMPVSLRLNYKLIVEANAVPEGEIIRCWLPYPKENFTRQKDVKLIYINSDDYIISPEHYRHKTLYIEKISEKDKPVEFEYTLEYTGYNEWHKIDPASILDYNSFSADYIANTGERTPHIIFTDKIKNLSAEITESESNPYLKAKKIYKWINDNIPWAGAREYSTIYNIPDYCISNGWGDCGIQTLLFMTLCRYNGIPARWQSGWMLHPREVNLHDWCEIYFEGIGWIPVDQSFKLVDSDDEDVRWFFFGGIDAFHLIVNNDYSQPLFPAKIFPRSETVDFQRGEVEWKGGNLYFDQWDYFMTVEYLNPSFE